MDLEERIKKLEEEINRLNQEKCNIRPFIWLNDRVGQLERRLDNLKLDNWDGDLSPGFDRLYQNGDVGRRYASC